MSLNRFELGEVTDLKIINKLVLKLLMSLRVSRNMVYCNEVIKQLGNKTHLAK